MITSIYILQLFLVKAMNIPQPSHIVAIVNPHNFDPGCGVEFGMEIDQNKVSVITPLMVMRCIDNVNIWSGGGSFRCCFDYGKLYKSLHCHNYACSSCRH